MNAISKGMYNRITKPGSKVIPKRSTVIALAINLGLNIMETLELLAPLKYTLNEALEGVDSVIQMISATEITVSGLIAFIAFNMTSIVALL